MNMDTIHTRYVGHYKLRVLEDVLAEDPDYAVIIEDLALGVKWLDHEVDNKQAALAHCDEWTPSDVPADMVQALIVPR